MGLFSELCLNTPSDRDLTMHSSHIQTTLVIKMSETARTGHQDSFVLRLSRETTNRVDGLCVHKSVLYVCISIPALQVGSSAPFL